MVFEDSPKQINVDNIQFIVKELDNRLELLFEGEFPKDYFFLAGGGASLMFHAFDNARGRYFSKDLDFIWVQNWKYNEQFVETLKKNRERFLVRGELYEPYPSDETFISIDMFSGIEGDETNKYLIEFMAGKQFIEKNSEYSQLDFRKDLLEYFVNHDFDDYYKYIKICLPYVTWYTRLVTLRDENGRVYTGSSIEDSDYYNKNYLEMSEPLKDGIISVKDIEDNIGYLVYKYYKNSPIVIEDFNRFIQNLREEFGD